MVRDHVRRAAALNGTDVYRARAEQRIVRQRHAANALEHTPAGGLVELSVATAADTVTVTVTDDGFGVDERLRPHVFERFASGSRSGGGTGLGLYIVRRIAEEIGGSVRYAPREPRGSVFTLTLPKAPA